jgi:hypothetical protein
MQKVKWSREEKKKKLIPSFRDIGIILRGYKRFIILILALAVSLTTWWYIQKEQAWVFSETEYEGLINLDKSELDRVIENQFGRLMNKIRTHELENRIRGQFVEISEIRAEKMFPDRVKFTIVEKIPIALYININGYYLIDINGEVIQAYNSETPYSFSRQDYEIARGFGSPNADYVEERIFNELSEEEMPEFVFAEFDYSRKEEVLKHIETERKIKINDVIKSMYDKSLETISIDTQIIYGWDELDYSRGDVLEEDVLAFLLSVIKELEGYSEIRVDEILWDGDQRMILFFNIDGEIIISKQRDVRIQFEDLGLIVKNIGEIDKIKRIDLSVPKVVVDYR